MFALTLGGAVACGGYSDSSEWNALFNSDLSNADKLEGAWSIEQGVMTASEDKAVWRRRHYDDFVLDMALWTETGRNPPKRKFRRG